MTRAQKASGIIALRWRSTLAGSVLLLRRRAKRDLALLATWVLLAAFAVVLAFAGPRLMVNTVDRGAQQAVAQAGPDADVVVTFPTGVQRPSILDKVVAPADVLKVASDITSKLPRALEKVAQGSTVSVLGQQTEVAASDVTPPLTVNRLRVSIGMLNDEATRYLTVDNGLLPVDGPQAPDAPVDVVISSAAASASSLSVGSILNLHDPSSGVENRALPIRVVGVVDRNTSIVGPSPWTDLPGMWNPKGSDGKLSRFVDIVALTPSNGILRTADFFGTPLDATVRIRLDPAAFTHSLEARVASDIDAITVDNSMLVNASEATIRVSSGFDAAMDGYVGQARAATAQMSIVLVGVLGVTVAVLILLSRLLVARRMPEIALERARGASIAAIGVRFLIESFVATAIALVLGSAIAWLVPGSATAALVIAVIVVAVLAAPVQAVIASSFRLGRAAPANRRDRLELVRRSAARRIALEVSVVALAAAAIAGLGSRGLLQGTTAGVDPLLSTAPLLLAGVVTIIVLRVYRWPVRFVGTLARRTRGVLGLLGAVRAQRSMAALPVLALTLAVALTVGSGLISTTVNVGQQDASWQRVGAEVRVSGPVGNSELARVSAAPGVTAATAFQTSESVSLDLGTATSIVTLLGVDSHYNSLLKSLPDTDGVAQPTSSAVFAGLADASTSDRLPVLVDSEIADRLISKKVTILVNGLDIPVRVVGTAAAGPAGYLTGPFMYIDLSRLSQRVSQHLIADTMLVTGPGAERAVVGAGISPSRVTTRDGWLGTWNHQAMVSGVQNVLLLSIAALAVLAIIALLATVLAGAGERARSLSLLRTIGIPARLGWWLALSELTPLVVAALLGGTAAGLAVIVFLGPSLGLGVLAGGLYVPQPVISWSFLAVLVVATAMVLAIAVLVEVLLRRRDRLSEVLRVGETV